MDANKSESAFIVESPPKDGDDRYFYNEKTEGRLKKKIFDLLGISEEETAEKGFQKFKERNLFPLTKLALPLMR